MGIVQKGYLSLLKKGYSAINGVNIFPYTITPEVVIDEETYTGWAKYLLVQQMKL